MSLEYLEKLSTITKLVTLNPILFQICPLILEHYITMKNKGETIIQNTKLNDTNYET